MGIHERVDLKKGSVVQIVEKTSWGTRYYETEIGNYYKILEKPDDIGTRFRIANCEPSSSLSYDRDNDRLLITYRDNEGILHTQKAEKTSRPTFNFLKEYWQFIFLIIAIIIFGVAWYLGYFDEFL